MFFPLAQVLAPTAPSSPAQQTQSAMGAPSSPGSSPAHWTTKSFVGGAVTVALLGILAWAFWKRLIGGVRENVGVRVVVYFSEAAAAIGLSVVASYFDVFKKSTYVPTSTYQLDWHVMFW